MKGLIFALALSIALSGCLSGPEDLTGAAIEVEVEVTTTTMPDLPVFMPSTTMAPPPMRETTTTVKLDPCSYECTLKGFEGGVCRRSQMQCRQMSEGYSRSGGRAGCNTPYDACCCTNKLG